MGYLQHILNQPKKMFAIGHPKGSTCCGRVQLIWLPINP
jgi:hypothetical protein